MMNKAEPVAKFLRITPVAITATLCLSLLSACATQLSVGATETALRRLYGEPALAIRLDSGARWFYTSGPLGVTTYAVDMNKDGIAERVQNVLTDTMLEKIGAGNTAEAVLASIGPPIAKSGLIIWVLPHGIIIIVIHGAIPSSFQPWLTINMG